MDLSPADRDLAIRTVIGEANGQPDDGQAAVAHVILNRVNGGWGKSPSEVVLAKGQFEPWATRAGELLAINPKSPKYQAAAKIVDGAASGEIPDPTSGATYFLQPDIVNQRYGKLPNWATGKNTQIGDHVFYYGSRDGSGGQPKGPTMAQNAPGQSGDTGAVGSVTPDDIDETLKLLGLAKGLTKPKPAAAVVPVSAAPGVDKDVAETARMLGIDLKAKPVAPAASPDVSRGDDGRLKITIRPRPKGVPESVVAQSQLSEGMPIVGPLLNKATAAIGAGVVQPVMDAVTGQNYGDTFGQRYDNNLKDIVQTNKDYSDKNPIKSTAANLMGGTMLMGPLGGTKVGGTIMGTYGPSFGSKAVTGGLGGAGIGVTDAALRDEGIGTGAIVGGAGGVAGPFVSSAARGATNFVTNNVLPRTGPLRDVPANAVTKLVQALQGETPQSIQAGKARMGPAGMLSDLNPNMTDLAGGIADLKIPAKFKIRSAYDKRAEDHAPRVKKALDDAMAGPAQNVEDLKKFHVEQRSEAADPLYKQWREAQVHPTDEIKALMPRLEKAGAFDMAEELSGISGKPINKKFFTPGNDKHFPTTESWDYVKRGLDRRIDQAYRAGDNTLGRELVKLKNEMIDEIGKTDAGKTWKEARSKFAERSALIDQIDAGKDTFLGGRHGISVDQLREELKGLSAPELQARIIGARSAAEDVIDASRRGDIVLRTKMLAGTNVKKMELLLGKAKADQLVRVMEQESYLGSQHGNVIGNQNTGASNMSRRERVEVLKPDSGHPWNPDITQPLSFIPPGLREEFRPSNIVGAWRGQNHAASMNSLADMLTTPASPGLDRLLRSLQREGTKRSVIDAKAAQVGNALGGLVSGPATTAARRQYFPAQ